MKTLNRALRLMMAGAALSPLLVLSVPAQAGTWSIQSENVASILLGVDAIGASTLYVAGGADGVGPIILKSTDGGKSYVQQIDSLQTMSYMAIDASDGQHALAGGLGAFYRFAGASYTQDGNTWRPSRDRWLASAYQDVEAASNEHMYLIGMWSTMLDYGEGVAASSDGGRTFYYFDWGMDTSARYGSFISPAVGFIAGGEWPDDSLSRVGGGDYRFSQHVRIPGEAMPERAGATGYRATIAKTVNGGESWELLFDDYDRFYLNQIEFTDELNGWVVAEGDEGAYILGTHDGGYTWTEQHMQVAGSLMALKMVNAQEGWAGGATITPTGFKSLLLHTTDGGNTWVEHPETLRYWIMNIDTLPDGRAWAVALNPASMFSILQYVP
ncbi:MAG: WD40/YVTN/BNR-like repeat-containing protein [Myxococcota bacterium]